MKTMVGAVAHDVTEGKVLVNGVAYSIKQGKTLVNGVAYDIGGEIEAPTQAELWADAVYVTSEGTNGSSKSTVQIKEWNDLLISGNEVFIFAFYNRLVAAYCLTGAKDSDGNFTPTGKELIYNVPNNTQPGILLDGTTVSFALSSETSVVAGTAYGATLLAVEFPAYSKEQVSAAFANLKVDKVKVSTTSYETSWAGRNAATTGSCAQYYSAFVNCEVMFAAVSQKVKVYTAGLGNSYDTLTATFQTDSGVILGSLVGSYGSKYNVVNGTNGAVYGATLIGLKEEV